jgi:CheY-like chemotaxis protein
MQARSGTPADKLVVVIDDDRTILQAMEGLLRGWGYDVVVAASETQALDRLAASGRRPDLIISDHRLAEGRLGFQAIGRLREAFEIPALLITADRTVDAPASRDRVLLKPLNPDRLKDALDQAFKGKP